jgi:UDP-N-acetylglucosamine 4,6-dehydratase
MKSVLEGKTILVTGGTGSFGKKFIRTLLSQHNPKKVIIYSRDELKQYEMSIEFQADKRLRFFIGDVRDKDRIYRAFAGVDFVVHAAAMKHVGASEYNPMEAIKTNINGAENIVNAAIDCGVQRVVALSTDKASSPVNLYGATKLVSDKLFVAGNAYSGSRETRFSVVRYGNVVGSRGSVVPFFRSIASTGVIPITDVRMTRFWITLQHGVDFVINAFDNMVGGEIFVPKIPSMNVIDLAKAIAPDCELKIVGIRPGEKLHEEMISIDDARRTVDLGSHYAILPEMDWWTGDVGGIKVPDDFVYSSDVNSQWLSIDQLRDMANE